MLIHDLHHLAWRAFHVTGGLKYGGDSTGVIFGVLREIQGTGRLFPDPIVVIACDSRKSLRRDIFPGYKDRAPKNETEEEKLAREDCIRQIGVLKKEVLPVIGFKNIFEYDGFEADDIIAELVFRKSKWGKPLIITGDEDMYQLLARCNMWIPGKRKMMNERKFTDEYGIPPVMWKEVKAIGGCSSDTVPGVKGVGPPSAIKYLLGKMPGGAMKRKIQEAEESGSLDLMRKLVYLPFPGTPVSSLRPTVCNREGFLDVCDKYGMNTLADDIDEWEEMFRRR